MHPCTQSPTLHRTHAHTRTHPLIHQERFDVLHKLNAPSENSPGSPYLQSRITAAHKVLLEEMAKADKSKKALVWVPMEGEFGQLRLRLGEFSQRRERSTSLWEKLTKM